MRLSERGLTPRDAAALVLKKQYETVRDDVPNKEQVMDTLQVTKLTDKQYEKFLVERTKFLDRNTVVGKYLERRGHGGPA